MNLEEYVPLPSLVTKKTLVKKSRFPVIDAHNHLDEEFGGGWINRPLSSLLALLDDVNVKVLVDLDGGSSEKILQKHLNQYKQKAPETFRIFGGVDWQKWADYGNRFPEYAAQRIREQVRWGAEGLKIWKDLGLHVRDSDGNLVQVDDPRLQVIWQTAAELNLPVMIHTGDPVAFFDPLDERNERYEELITHPEWHVPSPPYPKFEQVIASFSRLIQQNKDTTFIGAHMAGYAENLRWVGRLLDKFSNLYVDLSGRVAELGRQPYTARRFFIHYADRILFGLDEAPDKLAYQTAYRFLETDDEYFNYSSSVIPPQGRWNIYGLYLPDDVLKKVYFDNAHRALRILQ